MPDSSDIRSFVFALSRALIASAAPDDPALPNVRRVLLTKVGTGSCRTLTDLAASLGMPLSSASTHAKELERQGLLSRRRAAGDERSLELRLTPAGRERVMLRDRFHPAALDHAMVVLGRARLLELLGGLEAIAEAGLEGLAPEHRTRRRQEWSARRPAVDPDVEPGERAWDLVRAGGGGGHDDAAFWRQAFAAAAMRVLFTLRQDADPFLAEHHMRLLLAVGLSRHETLSALAAELGIPLSTASGQVKAMESRGLLSRSRRYGNERALLLTLTPAGRQRMILRRQFDARALDDAISALGPTRLRRLIRLLDLVAEAALTALDEPLGARRRREWETWRFHNAEDEADASEEGSASRRDPGLPSSRRPEMIADHER